MSTPPVFPGPQPGVPPASEASLRHVVDGMHEAVVVRDAGGVIIYVNDAAERVFGRTSEQLIGGTSVTSGGGVHADGTPFPPGESAASVALETGRDVIDELVGMHMDGGELRWLWVNARALRDDAGSDAITGVLSTFVDVTEYHTMVAALAESERRFRLLAENAGDLITSTDPQGIRTYVSPSCRVLLGYEPEELIGLPTVEIVHPDDRATISAYFQCMLAGAPSIAAARFVRKDGEAVWFETRGRAVRDENGTVVELQTVARDITRQRESEETLRASEAAAVAAREALEAVLDATTQYAIIGTDADGLITVFNGGAERMVGYRAAEVVGRFHPVLFHDPEELEGLAEEFGVPVARVLGYGTRDEDTDTREWMFVHKDGHKLPVSLTITAIRSPGGRLTGYLGIGRDITAERQAARELRDAEERFRNAFDKAPIGKALVSSDGVFMRVNSALCTILGYEEHELLGTAFQTLTHPEDLGADLEHMRLLLRRESESYDMEKRYRHAAGHYIWALLSVSLVWDENGVPLYFVSQIQDISEQRQTAERLMELTLHDALTGLANRVLFTDRLTHAVERARATDERVAVLFIDFDLFKVVNDTYGHAAGDELLRQAAARMGKAVRPADTIARLGGDEFTVLCEDIEAEDGPGRVAERLGDALERPFDLFGTVVGIGVSIGIAMSDANDDAEKLLARADAAMYRAKNDRRDLRGAA